MRNSLLFRKFYPKLVICLKNLAVKNLFFLFIKKDIILILN